MFGQAISGGVDMDGNGYPGRCGRLAKIEQIKRYNTWEDEPFAIDRSKDVCTSISPLFLF